jgi:hypothetical protein
VTTVRFQHGTVTTVRDNGALKSFSLAAAVPVEKRHGAQQYRTVGDPWSYGCRMQTRLACRPQRTPICVAVAASTASLPSLIIAWSGRVAAEASSSRLNDLIRHTSRFCSPSSQPSLRYCALCAPPDLSIGSQRLPRFAAYAGEY